MGAQGVQNPTTGLLTSNPPNLKPERDRHPTTLAGCHATGAIHAPV